MISGLYDDLIALDVHLENAMARNRGDADGLMHDLGPVHKELVALVEKLRSTVNAKDIPAEIGDYGWVKPRITYTMDGQSYVLALFRYGDRYFFRDAGAPLSKTRCSFNIKADDLKACIEQADGDPSPLGDILYIELYQDDTPAVSPVQDVSDDKPGTRGMTLFDYMDEEGDP